MTFTTALYSRQKKRGSLSRVKSTPKEEGGGDNPEPEDPLTNHFGSHALHCARTKARQQELFVRRTNYLLMYLFVRFINNIYLFTINI